MITIHKRPFVAPNAIVYSYEVSKCFLPPNLGSILEVGCGFGIFAFRHASSHKESAITAVDYSKETIEFLSSRYGACYSNLKFQKEDFCDPNLDLGTRYDAVYSSDVIEHVIDRQDFISNLHKHLKPDGTAVINFPNETTHGINHFNDIEEIKNAFSEFKAIHTYGVDISHSACNAWFSLRSAYERLFSTNTDNVRKELYDEREEQGIDCFEDSTCFRYFKGRSQAFHTAASLLAEAFLLIKPRISIRKIGAGTVLNTPRLVVVAQK